jgi:hypothetical protein
MRYRLRTLLILVSVGPPILACIWFNPSFLAFVVAIVLANLAAFAILCVAAAAVSFLAGLLLRQ